MSLTLTPVHGTFANDDSSDQWYRPGSAWWTYMETQGCEPSSINPFVWTGELVGLDFWWWLIKHLPKMGEEEARRLRGWILAGRKFATHMSQFPISKRVVIAHSHGLQPVRIAAAMGCQIDRLVSIGSPVRYDVDHYMMVRYGSGPRTHIRYWEHILDVNHDPTGVPHSQKLAGQIGDGVVSIDRRQHSADLNVGIVGIGHSGMVSDPSKFPLWQTMGILARLESV